MKTYADECPFALKSQNVIGLLTSTGSYNIDRYPFAYKAYKRQQQIHWLGEEVPLGEDLKDFQSDKISEPERNLLTQIFRFFTQSDIEVSDNYFKRYIPIFEPLEIQMMMAAFSNAETIHIDAYALLLKTLGMPESEFTAFKKYEAMQEKSNYMHTFGVKTCGDVARTLAMFGAFTEGMVLFASFAMLMNFTRFNKMKGMGQIIAWSIRDESLHCESMIQLFHAWNQETKAVTPSVQQDIYDVCQTMVRLEDCFIDLAFDLGDVQGMQASDIKAYIRYIADWRLTQLKMQPIYGFFSFKNGQRLQHKPHPLLWLSALLNGVEHANFFEARATEYSKVATLGLWHGDQGAWNIFDQIKDQSLEKKRLHV